MIKKFNKILIFAFLSYCTLMGCKPKNDKKTSIIEVKKLNNELVKKIMETYDSFYVENNDKGDFRIIEHYFIKDSTENKILKDSNGIISGISVLFKGENIFAEEYYSNGQSKGVINFETPGIIHGPVKFYYPNGRIRATGKYDNGFKIGLWYEYDSLGKLKTLQSY